MKRVLSISAVVAALFMVSCGGSTPSDAAVEVYQMVIDGLYDAVERMVPNNASTFFIFFILFFRLIFQFIKISLPFFLNTPYNIR